MESIWGPGVPRRRRSNIAGKEGCGRVPGRGVERNSMVRSARTVKPGAPEGPGSDFRERFGKVLAHGTGGGILPERAPRSPAPRESSEDRLGDARDREPRDDRRPRARRLSHDPRARAAPLAEARRGALSRTGARARRARGLDP